LEFKDFSRVPEQSRLHRFITASYNMSLLASDKIFCRDKQVKKFVWGSLMSLGRLDLDSYRRDKNFSDIIEEAPFGVDKEKPKSRRSVYRGKLGNIGKNDTILLWNGGVWNWNDAETLVAAMERLKKERIKLVFQGFRHPGKYQKISEEARRALAVAKRTGLKDKNIFFSDEWVPYDRRSDFLLESDIGVVSSPDIPEASMFFKTRIYDHFWAELPTILNDCEAFADIIGERQLGLVAKTGDPGDWARKIKELARDKRLRSQIKKNIRSYKKEITWDKTLEPVKRFADEAKRFSKKREENELTEKNIKLNKNIINDHL
jgi:glycosyltransferase involved in cell wall biosynthesis